MDMRKRDEEPERVPFEADPPLRHTMIHVHEALCEIRDALDELGGAMNLVAQELQRMRQER